MIVTRFAPSPTGHIHLGNARVAVLCYCLARQQNGRFILRMDDTDRERSQDCFAEQIQSDLAWLGLSYDDIVFQSKRQKIYEKAIQTLKDQGRLYPCYETPEELTQKREAQRQKGLPPRYDRSALLLTDHQKETLAAEGRTPHWRFLLTEEDVTWNDLIFESMSYSTHSQSDPILVRSDHTASFLLTGSVDDIDLGITHIVRGEDHVANTTVQMQIMKVLSPNTLFKWGHMPLLKGGEGLLLSKRYSSLSLKQLREDGYLPAALRDFLVSLGTLCDTKTYDSWESIFKDFSFKNYTGDTRQLTLNALETINKTKMAALSTDDLQKYLADHDREPAPDTFFDAIRENLEKWPDLLVWHTVCYGDTPPQHTSEPSYIQEALDHLPPEPWDPTTWKNWTNTLKAQTKRLKRALYQPLRQALTGHDHGPPMGDLLPLIGYERAQKRLQRTLQQ